MTDIHSPGIFNPQRNSNTQVQASTLQSSKGPLNTMLNLQALRTVKGRINLPLNNTIINGIYPVFNEYDSSPIQLYSGDIILSVILSNGNPTYGSFSQVQTDIYSVYGVQSYSLLDSYIANSKRSYPIPFQEGSYLTVCLGEEPIYNYSDWIPNTNNLLKLTDNFDLYQLMFGTTVTETGWSLGLTPNVKPQAGVPNIIYKNSIGASYNQSNTCYSGKSQWLSCLVSNIQLYSNKAVYPSINATFLILNSSIY